MQSQYRGLHYSASRGKNSPKCFCGRGAPGQLESREGPAPPHSLQLFNPFGVSVLSAIGALTFSAWTRCFGTQLLIIEVGDIYASCFVSLTVQ